MLLKLAAKKLRGTRCNSEWSRATKVIKEVVRQNIGKEKTRSAVEQSRSGTW